MQISLLYERTYNLLREKGISKCKILLTHQDHFSFLNLVIYVCLGL